MDFRRKRTPELYLSSSKVRFSTFPTTCNCFATSVYTSLHISVAQL